MTYLEWAANMDVADACHAASVIRYAERLASIGLADDGGTLGWTERYRRALNACAVNLGAVATRYQCNAARVHCTTRGANPGACERHRVAPVNVAFVADVSTLAEVRS
jgi:hypothetical protein